MLALHMAIGFVLAAGFVALLLAMDPGGIGSLLRHPTTGIGPPLLLWFFTGSTFSAVQFGAAVMLEDGSE